MLPAIEEKKRSKSRNKRAVDTNYGLYAFLSRDEHAKIKKGASKKKKKDKSRNRLGSEDLSRSHIKASKSPIFPSTPAGAEVNMKHPHSSASMTPIEKVRSNRVKADSEYKAVHQRSLFSVAKEKPISDRSNVPMMSGSSKTDSGSSDYGDDIDEHSLRKGAKADFKNPSLISSIDKKQNHYGSWFKTFISPVQNEKAAAYSNTS